MDITSKLLALPLLFATLAASAAQPPASSLNSATAAPAPAKHAIGKVNKQLQAAARKKPRAAEQPAQIRVAR
jgi:hypothetical protein